VSLYLRTQAGHKFTLLLGEPMVFRGSDFREGNILFDVKVRDASGLAPAEIAELLELSEVHAKVFDYERWLSKARENSLLLVESTPSYGGEFTAVCANIQLSDGYQLP
jgi:hypothetical protein